MAATAYMQTLLTSPVSSLGTRNRITKFSPATNFPRLQKSLNFSIRCSAKEGPKEESSPQSPMPSPPRSPKMSTKFSDLLAFSGPAPERINGRLAMIGFVAALAVELSKGQDVFAQISDGSGIPLFLGTSVLFTLASLIPLFKGVSVESKSNGVMSSDAELWNGRFAMLGLVALAFTEFVKGGTLV